MNRDSTKNIGHSVFQRLLNRANADKEDFNFLLSRYGAERFLYRLSISPYSNRFVLKGASLFLVWKGQNYRLTRDVDFLGLGNPDMKFIGDMFREICGVACPEDDGMLYLSDLLKIEEIREDHEYDGLRITLSGMLHHARIPLQIDVGFGDMITPAPEDIEYPTILNAPAPRLKAYPRYTLAAEKFEVMVKLGLANSRMKDFYDIWLVARLFDFDGIVLCNALKNTLDRRRTPLPVAAPFALTPPFYKDAQKQRQWEAFVKKAKPDVAPGSLAAAIADISDFLLPVLNALQMDVLFENRWLPGQGWVSPAADYTKKV